MSRLRSAWSAPPLQRPARHPVRNGRRLVPRASLRTASGEPLPGPLVLDLVAAVLAGGASPTAALRVVGGALSRTGDPAGRRLELLAAELMHPSTDDKVYPPSADDWVAVLREELVLAVRSGLPPTALLRRAAEERRRRTAAAQRRAVQRLEVLLVVPTGTCLLPAFVLLGIVPVVLGLLRG
jgi:hypothetical protein